MVSELARGYKRNANREMLTSAMAAKILNIHVNTIIRWANLHIIPCYRLGPRRDRRFRRQDVLAMLEVQS